MSTTNEKVTTRNILDHCNQHLKDLVNVVRAHDHVHPDRNECGGVGGCRLMAAECDAEQELCHALMTLARRGTSPRLVLVPEAPR